MSLRVSSRKPYDAVDSRRCRVCGLVVFWLVPSPAGPPFVEMVYHPRCGPLTEPEYYCRDHHPSLVREGAA